MNGELGLHWEIFNPAYTHKWHDHALHESVAQGMFH
jgi:hypothetical protein